MAESPISSPEAPLLGELSSDSETERLYFAAAFLFYTTIKNQSIVVFVRPTPSTAVEIFFQLLQPQTPSARRLVRRW